MVELVCKKIYRFKIVLFKEERDINYLRLMNWYKNLDKFVFFEMVYYLLYIFIIGLVFLIVEKEWEEFIDNFK